MMRSFKYRLHPNQAQARELEIVLLQCGELFNAALEQRVTASKAESAGKHLVPVDPRGTSQRCSGCNAYVEKKTLAQRTHNCPTCGLTIDRDHNAAINVLTRGLRVLELAQASVEGEASLTHGRAGVFGI